MVTSVKSSAGSDEKSDSRRLSTGSSAVLFAASSLRALPRTHPFCTKVSLPSGLTSVIVACRSTLGAEERTQALTAPAPITRVSAGGGSLREGTALAGGLCSHSYSGVAVQRPPSPAAVSPVKSVGGSASASHVNPSAPRVLGGASVSPPSDDRYQALASVPGTGNWSKDASKPG